MICGDDFFADIEVELIPMNPSLSDKVLDYEGDYDDNRIPHGQGILRYVNGSQYKGEFKRGHCHGQGELRKPPKGGVGKIEVYTGQFRFGKPHGQGVLRKSNGHTFKGTFEGGVPHGSGILSTRHGTFNAVYDNGVCASRQPVTWMVDPLSPKKKGGDFSSSRRRHTLNEGPQDLIRDLRRPRHVGFVEKPLENTTTETPRKKAPESAVEEPNVQQTSLLRTSSITSLVRVESPDVSFRHVDLMKTTVVRKSYESGKPNRRVSIL
eukprot:PhF_6_TR11326/c0_g1_i1/m.18291